jgi:hypothetical protein
MNKVVMGLGQDIRDLAFICLSKVTKHLVLTAFQSATRHVLA